MGFFLTLALWAVLFIAGELLRPKPRLPQREPGRVEPPTAEEGGVIPVIFGTVKIGVNVTWYGPAQIEQVARRIRTGLFSSRNLVIGHKYRIPMQQVICHGTVDQLVDIWFGDYSLKKAGPASTTWSLLGEFSPTNPALPLSVEEEGDSVPFFILTDNLFGGEEFEGGVEGTIEFFFGTETQEVDDYIATVDPEAWASQLPLPGICHAVLHSTYLGMSPVIKPMYYEVARWPKCLLNDPEIANINGDANPAEIIFEALTNYRWGMNTPYNAIDLISFMEAAETLKAEGFGISLAYTGQGTGEDLIAEVLRHIDGVLYTDPTSGLIGLRLIRGDYVEEELPVLDESSYTDLEFSRGQWRETINEVKVEYTNAEGGYQPSVAQAQNLASAQATGDVNTETYQMRGITKPELAQRVAERICRTTSVPLAKATFRANRNAALLKKGDPFVLRNTRLGIDGLVMRVTRINYGSLENGVIPVDAVEDVFDSTGLAYSPPPTGSSGFTDDPDLAPQVIVRQSAIEAPYWFSGGTPRILAIGSRPSGVYEGYEVWGSLNGAPYDLMGFSPVLVPTGLLEARYSATTAARDPDGFIITMGRDVNLLNTASEGEFLAGVNLVMINDEIMAWKSIEGLGGGRYLITDILRGVLDTVPQEHAPLSVAYFISLGSVLIPDSYTKGYAKGDLVSVKMRPVNDNGELDLASATAVNVNIGGRALAPAPPGNVRLNGVGYEDWGLAFVSAQDAVLTWSHRNRVEQGQSGLVAQDVGGTYTLEGTYTVEVDLVSVDLESGERTYYPQVHRTQTGLTDGTFTYTLAERLADDTDPNKFVVFRIIPVSGDLVGTVRETPLAAMPLE